MARRIEIAHFSPRGRDNLPRQRSRRTIDAAQTVWIEPEQDSGNWTEYDPAQGRNVVGAGVPCCKTRVGSDILWVEGTKATLEEQLLPRDCPPARQLGYSITVTHGFYVIEGELCGDLELAAGAPKHHLDPRRLATAEGWHLHRQPGDSTSRYSITLRGEPEPRFVLQRLEKHPEPGQDDRWVDVTATLTGIQAGGRLRPKP